MRFPLVEQHVLSERIEINFEKIRRMYGRLKVDGTVPVLIRRSIKIHAYVFMSVNLQYIGFLLVLADVGRRC